MSTTNVRTRASGKSVKWVRKKIHMNRYNVGELIARGAFSRVYVATTTKFLLGEDSQERLSNKFEEHKKTRAPSVCENRDNTLRNMDIQVPIPKTVAIKVMKIRSRATSVPNQPITSALTRRKRSILQLFDKEESRASVLAEEKMSATSLKKFRQRKMKKKVQTRKMDDIFSEISFLKQVRASKFCVYLHDVVYLNQEVWLVMDFEEIGDIGSFFHYIYKRKPLKELPNKYDALRWFITPILLALQFLHERGMIHRDVKGGNILVTRSGIPKLCDFGLVQVFKELPVETRESFAGTPMFVPPEVYVNEKLARSRKSLSPAFFHSSIFSYGGHPVEEKQLQRIDTSFDTWSIAITMLYLSYGTSPWEYTPLVIGKNGKPVKFRKVKFPDNQLTRYLGSQLENEVKLYGYLRLHKRLYLLEKEEVEGNSQLRMPRTIPNKYLTSFSEEKRAFVKFIKRCLTLRDERPTVAQLLEDEYIQEFAQGWRRFDSKKEGNQMKIATTGKIKSGVADCEKPKFERISDSIALLAYNACS